LLLPSSFSHTISASRIGTVPRVLGPLMVEAAIPLLEQGWDSRQFVMMCSACTALCQTFPASSIGVRKKGPVPFLRRTLRTVPLGNAHLPRHVAVTLACILQRHDLGVAGGIGGVARPWSAPRPSASFLRLLRVPVVIALGEEEADALRAARS
jgi:hypothetical protein